MSEVELIALVKVAPRVGAWIETVMPVLKLLSIGRAPRGRVD